MTQTYTLAISNMTCGGCAARVGKVLEQVRGASDVRVNFAAHNAQVSFDDGPELSGALAALETAGYPAEQDTVRLAISGMSCAACLGRVQKALEAVPGVVQADVNLATEVANVRFVTGAITPAGIAAASTRAGYRAELTEAASGGADKKGAEAESARRSFLVAAVLTLPVFVLEMGGHVFPALHHLIGRTIGHEASWMLQFVLTALVLLGPGRGFFVTGVPALLRRAPTMNSLVALGAGAAFAFSTVALWLPSVLPQGTRAVYFEAAAVIVTLILLGRWFEARAKGRTGAAIQRLMSLTPPVARIRQGADWVEVPVAGLAVGDIFLLQPGERVPTDARVQEGASRVDESMITGEPMQVVKAPGDALTGGSVNSDGSLTCEVMRTGEDTVLAGIIRMVQDAQGARLPIQALVDRVTLWFVPAVMTIAALTVLGWLLFGPAPAVSHALVAGVAVLIIACPCAMGLATPTSIMVGTGRAAELGVLFRQGDALQSLSTVRAVAFDKTGTLTEGRPELTRFDCVTGLDADRLLAEIAAVESHSEHPLAQAILVAAKAKVKPIPQADGISVHAGLGISGNVGGHRITVGNAAMMRDINAEIQAFAQTADELRQKGQSVFFAARDGNIAAVLAVSDPVRPSSANAIAALKSAGLQVAMITGDAEATARAVARDLGIDTVVAEVLPGEKRAALQELRRAHGPVAFVGDGINDAPVLAEADVGIAIGTGTDVAIETADVVLMSGDVQGVVHAFEMSRRTLRNIRENLIWAFGYNVLLIPVAAGLLYPAFGLMLSPGLAAGAMAFSSVFVVANALRLRRAGEVS